MGFFFKHEEEGNSKGNLSRREKIPVIPDGDDKFFHGLACITKYEVPSYNNTSYYYLIIIIKKSLSYIIPLEVIQNIVNLKKNIRMY